jgi:hypothetical protein
LNYLASARGCQVKQVYLLPDVSLRFKGLFVAVPQNAMNVFDGALGHPAKPTMTIARCRRAIGSDQET